MNNNNPTITNFIYNERGEILSRITKCGYEIIESLHRSYNDQNKIEIEILQSIDMIINKEYKYLNNGTDSYEEIITEISKDNGTIDSKVKTYKYTVDGKWLFISEDGSIKQVIQYKDNERKIILSEISYYGPHNSLYLYRYIYNVNNQLLSVYENEKEIISVTYDESNVSKVIIYGTPIIKTTCYNLLKDLLTESFMMFQMSDEIDHVIHELKYDEGKKYEHVITTVNKDKKEINNRTDNYIYIYNPDIKQSTTVIERYIGRFIESRMQITEEKGCITKSIDGELISKEIFDDKNNLIRYEDYPFNITSKFIS